MLNLRQLGLISVCALFATGATTIPRTVAFPENPVQELQISLNAIIQNLNEPGIARGAVIASPSRREPDYFFHWVRDAGLVVATLFDQMPRAPQVAAAIRDWAAFERRLQDEGTSRGQGLGEPKYNVDGSVFTGPWGRPQNDGPAIRAWAYLRAYRAPDVLVERDLEYTRLHWRQADFDLWEEVKGTHFFTRYAQMAAFYKGAEVYAVRDPGRARLYANEARLIEDSLNGFVDGGRMLVVPTIGHQQGVQKPSGLDVSVILAATYFGRGARWSVANSNLMSTALRLEETFQRLYPVNQQYTDMAPGIGRYPEDVYDGNGFSGGNPWFLATFGMAEYYCALVENLSQAGVLRVDRVNIDFLRAAAPKVRLTVNTDLTSRDPRFAAALSGLQEKARSFIRRSLFHGGADRKYAEQFDRYSGFRRGARELTWSHASAVRAFQRCELSAKILQRIDRPSLKEIQ